MQLVRLTIAGLVCLLVLIVALVLTNFGVARLDRIPRFHRILAAPPAVIMRDPNTASASPLTIGWYRCERISGAYWPSPRHSQRVPPFSRFAVIPVALNVWLPILVQMRATSARRPVVFSCPVSRRIVRKSGPFGSAAMPVPSRYA